MADAAQYWLKKEPAKTQMKKLASLYNNIVVKAMEIGPLLSKNVGVDGIWSDYNAEVFIKWWNQGSASSGATGGNLKWKEKTIGGETVKMLQIEADGDDGYDGEDRIKSIIQSAGLVYWKLCCRTMTGLTKSHAKAFDDEGNKFFKYHLDQVKSLKDLGKSGNIKNTTWSDMMYNLYSKISSTEVTQWKSYPLTMPTSIDDGTTDTEKLAQFYVDLEKKLDKESGLVYCVNQFTKEVKATLDNQKDYWGFDSETMGTIRGEATSLNDKANSRVGQFLDDVNTALTAANEDIAADIKAIKEG